MLGLRQGDFGFCNGFVLGGPARFRGVNRFVLCILGSGGWIFGHAIGLC